MKEFKNYCKRWFAYNTYVVGNDKLFPNSRDINKVGDNIINYKSSSKLNVKSSSFNATIISNIFENGRGIIEFDDDLTSINDAAFQYCSDLESITIPNTVTSIGTVAFHSCTNLKSIVIPDGVTTINLGTFYNCTSLTSVTLGNNTTTINPAAFEGCTNLQTINIPNTVTAIGDSAFYNCTNLADIDLNNLTAIGDSAFSNCTGLTHVVIPSTITVIGTSAFEGCTNLEDITVLLLSDASSVSLLSYAFDNTNDCPIYIPSGRIDSYKIMEGWSSYADRIEPIPEQL